jgi:solute:Na+ symporter, SSS family
MHILDLSIILIILLSMIIFGLFQRKSTQTSSDYFLGNKKLPWVVAMFSIVATETSVLTFVSVPGIAFRGNWFFLQLAIGYIFGRILVSQILLPIYFKEGITSIYEVIGTRFGKDVQKIASAIFLITRVLADGVRFLATAVIIQVITGWSLPFAVIIIGIVTLIYTLSGGIKTVVWLDSIQFILYLSGGIITIIFIMNQLDNSILSIFQTLNDSNKLQIIKLNCNIFTDSWSFISAFIGGIFLSFASHGTDHMMVQRVLVCKDLSSAKKAMIGSGFFVFIQFAIFLFAGSLIWILLGNTDIAKDREFSTFIVEHLPIGLKGLLLAGVLSAAMSTLSSSINALASSTVIDWFKAKVSLHKSRFVTIIWAIILMGIALLFDESNTAIVIIGLKIASFTYAGLLGLFLMSRLNRQFDKWSLFIGLLSSILTTLYLQSISFNWTWYILFGVIINIAVTFLIDIFVKSKFVKKIILLVVVFGILSILKQFLYPEFINGLDVFEKSKLELIKDKKVGLVINHTSMNKMQNHIIDICVENEINVSVIFAPEHGFKGKLSAGEKFGDSIESKTKAKIVSLYGKNRIPKSSDMIGLDLIIYDIQDIGARYYTYISTLTNMMKICAENDIPMIVIDRPNPVNGITVSGNVLDRKFSSFVGMHPIPIRHGMTTGELAYMINNEWLSDNLKADLSIIKMKNWSRNQYYDEFIENWNPPSPNIPDLETAINYIGACLFEGTNISEGRGTEFPFMQFGAPFINSEILLHEINQKDFKGISFEKIAFTPMSIPDKSKYPKYEDILCNGFKVKITDREFFKPIETYITILEILSNLYPNNFEILDTKFIDKLYGSDELRVAFENRNSIEELIQKWDVELEKFKQIRNKYLLY